VHQVPPADVADREDDLFASTHPRDLPPDQTKQDISSTELKHRLGVT
jgi:hypothetical protein